MSGRAEFIGWAVPIAGRAIGMRHHGLVMWAVAKAGVECGWDKGNALIERANNCLGIKAEDGDGKPIAGVDYVKLKANTGPEAGREVHWRRFETVELCFVEFLNQLYDRGPWQAWRWKTVAEFEGIYTGGLKGHAVKVIGAIHEVREALEEAGAITSRGRFVKQ